MNTLRIIDIPGPAFVLAEYNGRGLPLHCYPTPFEFREGASVLKAYLERWHETEVFDPGADDLLAIGEAIKEFLGPVDDDLAPLLKPHELLAAFLDSDAAMRMAARRAAA